jgi:hypothetical protein
MLKTMIAFMFGVLALILVSNNAIAEDVVQGEILLGVKQVNWSNPYPDGIKLDPSLNQTAEFSLKYRHDYFLNAYLTQSNQNVANSTDKSSQYAVDVGLGDLIFVSESGNITGYASVTPTIPFSPTNSLQPAYQDNGSITGDFQIMGLFYRIGTTERETSDIGLMRITEHMPSAWVYAPNSCTTNTGYCQFTDLNTYNTMTMLAFRFDNLPLSQLAEGSGSKFYASYIVGCGPSSSTPSQRAVNGVVAATGIPLKVETTTGLGFYTADEFGEAWWSKHESWSFVTIAGVFGRMQVFNFGFPEQTDNNNLHAFADVNQFLPSFDYGFFIKIGVMY